ncbi:MAG: M23 family metallopeptidase [Prevotellaceae bacterium]|jgi:hypothetical protein|nr:M23 family metallopeptidase [Prevotellaceae bacterium]
MSKKRIRWHLKRLNLKDKYRLGIYNDTNYEEIFHFRLTGQGVLLSMTALAVIVVGFTIMLIAFTPLRKLIPGYPSDEMRLSMRDNLLKADSLDKAIDEWSYYLNNTLRIIAGDNPATMQNTPDSSFKNKSFRDVRSADDSILRAQVESEERFNLGTGAENRSKDLSGIHFFPPVKGEITNGFDAKVNHLGIDVVTAPNQVVLATLDGTVIMSEWTVETGNVIQIQHDNNLVSVYKHNAKLLQKQGNRVKAGDAVAIVGNSGEFSSGTHLHFELWYKGAPLNPEQYVVF